MIYFIFEEIAHRSIRYPAIGVSCKPYELIKMQTKYAASFVFTFNEGITQYIKDRNGSNYQYSSEDMVVLALKAVLL